MANDISLHIETAKLEEQLNNLPEKIRSKYVKAALQTAGDIILQEMVAQAPERTDEPTPDSDSLPPGVLKADLHTQLKGGAILIGPSEIAGPVARWIEKGWTVTGHGKSKRGRKKIKAIPGKHFMSGAVDVAGEAAVNAFVESLSNALGEDSHG
jgi:hypothetical protein